MNIKVAPIKWTIALSCIVLLSSFTLFPKPKHKDVYAYGVAADFSDSTVYFTVIQKLDSVKLTGERFLPERQQYSYQLKYHLENQGLKHRTCMIFFDTDKSKLAKKQNKLMERYLESHTQVKLLDIKTFHFITPEPSEPVKTSVQPQPKRKPKDHPKGKPGGPAGGPMGGHPRM